MKYAEIKLCDIANGTGVRTSLFVSGCTHHCSGCFNSVAWDFDYGKEFTEETVEEIITSLAPDYIEGLSLLGGEPMEPCNQRGLIHLLRSVKKRYPKKTIWVYTGYLYEDIVDETTMVHCEVTKEFLKYIDFIVDGEYIETLKDISLKFRGSSNQRILRLHGFKDATDDLTDLIQNHNSTSITKIRDTTKECYIRFGELPISEKSNIHYRGERIGNEVGVSVYRCHESNGNYYPVLPIPCKECTVDTLHGLMLSVVCCGKKVYLVQGTEVGVGTDGEPLLINVTCVGDITDRYKTYIDNRNSNDDYVEDED